MAMAKSKARGEAAEAPAVSLDRRLDQVPLAGATPPWGLRRASMPPHAVADTSENNGGPRPVSMSSSGSFFDEPTLADGVLADGVLADSVFADRVHSATANNGIPITMGMHTNIYRLNGFGDIPARPLPELASVDDSATDSARASNFSRRVEVRVHAFSSHDPNDAAAEGASFDKDSTFAAGSASRPPHRAPAAMALPALSEEGGAVFDDDFAECSDAAFAELSEALGLAVVRQASKSDPGDPFGSVVMSRLAADQALEGDVRPPLPAPQAVRSVVAVVPTADQGRTRARELYLVATNELAAGRVDGAIVHLQLALAYDADNRLYRDLLAQTEERRSQEDGAQPGPGLLVVATKGTAWGRAKRERRPR